MGIFKDFRIYLAKDAVDNVETVRYMSGTVLVWYDGMVYTICYFERSVHFHYLNRRSRIYCDKKKVLWSITVLS